MNIKKFEFNEEVLNYINSNSKRKIGTGTEGYVFLTKDNDTIKYIIKRHRILYNSEILTSELSIKSFMFPTEIILNGDYVAGYKANYFSNDIFRNACNKEFDLYNLLKARKEMIKDIKILSKEKYSINDLEYNLLFDGERLAAIDTLDYKKNKRLILSDNVYKLDKAIKYNLNMLDSRTILLNHLSVEEMINTYIKNNGSIVSVYKKVV